ncbi:haloacid dehalogenase [Clostridium gelidum]|uniref:Haloacid dehalogenase n=1 Tax=Clostridium gelidum TaxID=704125 RepID=A0ABM7T5G3_9CLOT|nr:HAD family hydrolase [Clostridium gelidum]BCZ46564.1 haloacid dehalogenase [Clostridium gelidum]
MTKAIFFDIDGTLIDCLGGIMDITPTVKKGIRNLQSNGHYVFIATGRPYAFLSQAILDFGFDGFILTNGTQVIIKNKTIYSEPMDKEFVKKAITEFEKLNIQYILEGELYSYMKNSCTEFYDFYDSIEISRKFLKSDYDIEKINTHKIEMLCPNEEAVNFCLSLMNSNPDYDHFHSIDAKALELYSKKNTKATGILTALEYLDIPIENSYAFGDGRNDIEMLSTVGCGIAMGNACDEVKKHAKKITDTVHNDGVAVGIKKYVLY